MAKRKFELPGIHELSKEQEMAIRLPKDGCHLIVGGPGTGKTVVALLRMRRFLIQADISECVFLVFNRLLHEAAKQLFGNDFYSFTWMSWFARLYWSTMQEAVPKQEESSFEFKPIDWQAVIDKIMNNEREVPLKQPFLFIDEGQDMPPEFYDALIKLNFENFYVVSDQNQAITADNSSRKQLEETLDINPSDVIELKHNYRNSYSVARLAREFYPDDPATPPIEMPDPTSSEKVPFLIEYGSNCRLSFDDVLHRILKMADRFSAKLIGILTPDNQVRKKYFESLSQIVDSDIIEFDNGKPQLVTYSSGEVYQFKFDEGGIFVINAQSCKGLEFDTVFIADINSFYCNEVIADEKKRLFYVMIARAIQNIFLLKEAGKYCPVEDILPKKQTILRYWS